MALILSIETGTEVCSVGLARDGELLSLCESGDRRHAQDAAIYVRDILRQHDISSCELDAIAIGRGPGSYTGLRIGTSLAKGLCYASKIPLIAINSLEAMVCTAKEDIEAGLIDIPGIEQGVFCPMIDARRMEVYCQLFDYEGKALSEIEAHIITPDSFSAERKRGPFVFFGSGAGKGAEALKGLNSHIIDVSSSAKGFSALAEKAFQESKFQDIAYFEPFYLKDFVVTSSKKKIF